MNFLMVVILIWKSFDILVSLIAQSAIPYLGFFSYGDTMFQYGLPSFIRALSNFDGIMYVRIATKGYSMTEQAYFPLYPQLIRGLNMIIHNPIIAGVVISVTMSIVGLILLVKYLPYLTESKYVKWILLALLCYPVSYYFGVMYTESLFFALMIATLLSLANKRYLLSGILGYLLALTRVQGVFILIPIAITAFGLMRSGKVWWKNILVGLGPILGLGTYLTYLWVSLGDPIYFVHAQESFGAHRSSKLILLPQVFYRYFKIFWTADMNFQYYVAVLEFAFMVFAIILLAYDLYLTLKRKNINWERLGINIFSWANILVPAMTGTLTAMPRYTLMSLSIFLVVGEFKSKWLKYGMFTTFVIFHVIMLTLFIQGYYVT
ncbi:MAG: hypothetical protein WCG44_01235 [bacterium]